MMLNLFDQFLSPTLLGTPLIIIAMIFPWIFFSQSHYWITNRFHSFQTLIIEQFSKQVLSTISSNGLKWSPILVSIFIFIISMNLIGLLPYTFTPTSQLSLNLGLAIPLWLGTVLVGFRNQMTTSLGHFLPEGTPTLLIPVLIIIETISLFIRPLSLGVRLTANITAGHLLIHLISMATMASASMQLYLPALTILALLSLTILEIAVAVIQAYVFVLLLSLYLQENT
uniref:ATP synthase subunit a n=1 Tax=Hemisus marmoratus TaxID=83971 RepID=W0TH12_9NEOB|nr:ATP synthase F0 subunit 6 [Hemisus marmoratus]BAO42902.1 ATPase subunit 6 [Hemisus marmoratus]